MEFLYQIESLEDQADYPLARPNADEPYVELHWYCAGRATPIAPYETLIVGYDDLTEPAKSDAAQYMDEWFTREEVALLIDYLGVELGHTLRVRRLPVPMTIFLDSGETIATPVALVLKDPSWRIGLTLSSTDDGYPLPFPVSAFYLTSGPEPGEAEPLV